MTISKKKKFVQIICQRDGGGGVFSGLLKLLGIIVDEIKITEIKIKL